MGGSATEASTAADRMRLQDDFMLKPFSIVCFVADRAVGSSGVIVLIHYLRAGGRLWQEIGKIRKHCRWQGWRSVGVTGLVGYHGAVRGFRPAGCCGRDSRSSRSRVSSRVISAARVAGVEPPSGVCRKACLRASRRAVRFSSNCRSAVARVAGGDWRNQTSRRGRQRDRGLRGGRKTPG